MKRIKLFEAFSSNNKITKVNRLLYYWALKTYIKEKNLKTNLSFHKSCRVGYKYKGVYLDKNATIYRFAIYGSSLEIEYFSNREITIFNSKYTYFGHPLVIDWFYKKRIITSVFGYGGKHRLPKPLVDAVKRLYEEEKSFEKPR